MKNTRLLTALMLGGLMACTAPAFAQDNKPDKPPAEARPGPRPENRGEAMKERLAKMQEELKLTDDQTQKVKTALQEQADKMRELRDLSPEERRPKADALREEMNTKMKSILTSEQYEKWTKLRDQNRAGRPGDGRGPGKPPGPEKKPDAN